jgi:hypothetical protein
MNKRRKEATTTVTSRASSRKKSPTIVNKDLYIKVAGETGTVDFTPPIGSIKASFTDTCRTPELKASVLTDTRNVSEARSQTGGLNDKVTNTSAFVKPADRPLSSLMKLKMIFGRLNPEPKDPPVSNKIVEPEPVKPEQ